MKKIIESFMCKTFYCIHVKQKRTTYTQTTTTTNEETQFL